MAKIIRVESCEDCLHLIHCRQAIYRDKDAIAKDCPLEDAPGTAKESLTVGEPIRDCIGGNEHNFQPAYSYGQPQLFKFSADTPASYIREVLEATKAKTYEGHVCRKCGAKIMKKP